MKNRCALMGGLYGFLALVTTAVFCAAAGTASAAYWPAACPTMSYRSAPALHAQRACENEGVYTHGTQPGTYLFMAPGGDSGKGAGIFQDNGVLVWWHGSPSNVDDNLEVVNYQGQPYLALWTGKLGAFGGYGNGQIVLYNKHYQQVGQITPGNGLGAYGVDLHEFKITPQGYGLIGVYQPVSQTYGGHTYTALQYVVQKITLVNDSSGIHTGSVVFQWNSLSDVPLSKSHVAPTGRTWDYFHGNAISQDTDGNLLVSSRSTWGIYKIDDTPGDAHYGHVIWQVGAPGDHTLSEPWCYQHDVHALGNNEYSLYDDGGTGPGCVAGSTQHPARGVIFRVNPSTNPAGVTLVRAYTHNPAIYTAYTGSTDVLSNGNVLVDWANVPQVTEYSSAGQVDMDLSLSDWSYRTWRSAWDGQPLTPPSAAAALGNGTTNVWASWNGSTEVTAWRVLGGRDASHLSAVTGSVGKSGFETGISVSGRYPTIEVQALNSSGHVLATSQPVATTGYLLATAAGQVYDFGKLGNHGSQSGAPASVVGIAQTPDGGGYWLVTSKGNVYNFGDAKWYGSQAASGVPAPVTGIAATPDGGGYWLVTSKGNVYNFGDAKWYGSRAVYGVPAPVTGIASTADGRGYWIATSAGNVFNYGDAAWHGSRAVYGVPAPVTGIAGNGDSGYWLTTSKGNVFNFGSAGWYGSRATSGVPAQVVGIARTVDGHGYWIATSAGNVFNYGDAGWYGSEALTQLSSAVTAIAGS